MRSPACRERVRVSLTTLPKLMQQTSSHWVQVYQTLQADERHLECLQHRLNGLQEILALDPAFPPEHCPALVSKVQALVSQEEALQQRIALKQASCQLLEHVFADAQCAQSVLLRQRKKTHYLERRLLQQFLKACFTQVQQAMISLALAMPGGMVPPI